MEIPVKLRGDVPNPRQARRAQDDECRGGLRNVWDAVKTLPQLRRIGGVVYSVLAASLDKSPSLRNMIEKALLGNELDPRADASVRVVRASLAKVLGVEHSGPISEADCPTDICGHLLARWVG